MDYAAIQGDLLRVLRGKRTQKQISEKMGFDFNQSYRWESGRTSMSWAHFLEYCQVCHARLPAHLKSAFSFAQDPSETGALVRHFVAGRAQKEISEEMGISRSSLSRWMTGRQIPNLEQMLQLMHIGSIDFYRFLETLSMQAELPSIQKELERERAYLKLYEVYPWLSVLFSALETVGYLENPSLSYLSKKTKIPVALLKDAIGDLQAQNLLEWTGKLWKMNLFRVSIRGSIESRREMCRYVLNRAMDGANTSFGVEGTRFSWKLFSLNEKQFDLLLQKYTEFFNELGSLIDKGQEGADKVYLFSTVFADFDLLPEMKLKPIEKL